jgi:hypothetical protein
VHAKREEESDDSKDTIFMKNWSSFSIIFFRTIINLLEEFNAKKGEKIFSNEHLEMMSHQYGNDNGVGVVNFVT